MKIEISFSRHGSIERTLFINQIISESTMWSVKALRNINTSANARLPSIYRNRMCATVLHGWLRDKVPHRFEIGERSPRNIWCNPDLRWCGISHQGRNASLNAREAESALEISTAGPTSGRSFRPVPSRTRTTATKKEKRAVLMDRCYSHSWISILPFRPTTKKPWTVVYRGQHSANIQY